jgi:predicted O-methyltransferase YrrM
MKDNVIDELLEKLKKINGWLLDEEAIFLYNQAKNVKGKGIILEIGSWHGKSTIWLAKGSMDGNNIKVYAIDPHTGSSEHKDWYGRVNTLDIFRKNIADFGVDKLIVPIIKTSKKAALEWNGEKIEFLWIDGAHEYKYVLLDYLLWNPFLIKGGIIAFHDTIWTYKGPEKVVNKYLFMGDKFKNVKFVGSITYGIKADKISFLDQIRNRVSYLKKILYMLILRINLLGGNLKIIRNIISKLGINKITNIFMNI